jgi:hypothetical protein
MNRRLLHRKPASTPELNPAELRSIDEIKHKLGST